MNRTERHPLEDVEHVEVGLFIEWPGGILEALPATSRLPRNGKVVGYAGTGTRWPALPDDLETWKPAETITGTIRVLGRGVVRPRGPHWRGIDPTADMAPLPTTRYARLVGNRLVSLGNDWPE